MSACLDRTNEYGREVSEGWWPSVPREEWVVGPVASLATPRLTHTSGATPAARTPLVAQIRCLPARQTR
jgi:hypothetical protein